MHSRVAGRTVALAAVLTFAFLTLGVGTASAGKPTMTKTPLVATFYFPCGIWDPTWSVVRIDVRGEDLIIDFYESGSISRRIVNRGLDVQWENLVTGTTARGHQHSVYEFDALAAATGGREGFYLVRGLGLHMMRDDHATFHESGWELISGPTVLEFRGSQDLTFEDFCAFMN